MPVKNSQAKIAFIRANSMRSDTRTIKMYQTLCKIGDCRAILWNRDEIKETNPPARRFYMNAPLGSKKILLFLPLWTIFCIWQLILIKPDAIHGCDLEGFIPAYFYSRLRRIPIVFDIHDVTAGKYALPPKSLLRRVFLAMDIFFIRRANAFFIPDPERIDQLGLTEKQFGPIKSKCFVTYNSDLLVPGHKQVKFKPGQQIKVVYVGNLTKGIRGVEFLMDAVVKFPEISFDIAGMGADLKYFQKAFEDLQSPNCHFHGRIGHDQAMELNERADLMISLLNPEFENYRYATSTKLFEAFRLFKPIIVSAKTATAAILEKTNWGLAIEYNSESLEKALKKIISGEISFDLDSRKVENYAWQKQEQIIIETYERLIHS